MKAKAGCSRPSAARSGGSGAARKIQTLGQTMLSLTINDDCSTINQATNPATERGQVGAGLVTLDSLSIGNATRIYRA